MDVTINTDFAQVEVDEQQVNLTRFGLFYPEKRDFFLENSNFFTMGTGSAFTSHAGADRPVLQPPHRPVGYRHADADPGRRAGGRQVRPQQHRRARHADRRCVWQAGRQFLRRPLQPRRAAALARRRDLHQQGDSRRQRRTSTARWAWTPTRAGHQHAGQSYIAKTRRTDSRVNGGDGEGTTWRSSAASPTAIRSGTCG